MDPIIEEFTITLKYQVSVNTEDGVMTTKCISRKIDKSNFEIVDAPKRAKKKKKEESSSPQLILEDNKYSLNSAAVELMGVAPDDKIDIKYESFNKSMRPIIGTDENFDSKQGNRLTKSFTVACRGSKNQELSKYGDVFDIIPHESKEGLFILKGNSEQESLEGDENISLDNIELDLDLEDLVEDVNVTEIEADFFKL